MPSVLHLGVYDVPYTNGSETTGDVASILQKKYGLFDAFYKRYGQKIADGMTNALAGQLENLMMGAPPSGNPYARGESLTQTLFDHFLTSGEIEGMGIEGVPTKAAIARRSLRFKSKKADGPRPSFVDTGTLDRSFKAWVD